MKGRARGFEPPNGGATSRCLNHLATPAASFRIYQLEASLLRSASRKTRQRPWVAVSIGVAVTGSAAALALSNPSMADYQTFAGGQLVDLATEELCGQGGLPMLLQLWIKDCPALISTQQPTLAALAGQFSTRMNLGVASVFTTEVGGQKILPALHLPRYRVTTLGVAGHFLPLDSRSLQAEPE